MPPIVLINAVGLTPRLLPFAPRLSAIAAQGWSAPLTEAIPAVTCTAQATLLTGQWPCDHGIVANGWLYRDTQEVRFWQQSNRLLQAEPLYVTARRWAKHQNKPFKSAKLFWWFNQGADVDYSVTPKPWYGVDGNKIFAIAGTPELLTVELERKLGAFPFPTFWGPMAGRPCTEWIAQAAALVLQQDQPDLTLVYLPHLDYDPQRHGPQNIDMARCVKELDDACEPLLDAARRQGADVWVVSEYGHGTVSQPVYLNRRLRETRLLKVRHGPFGEQLDLYDSLAFAVCDHQIAHVYVRDPAEIPRVRDVLAELPGVHQVYVGDQRQELNLQHARSGELVLLSERDSWFAYPFWLDDRLAPDYARAVAIHQKPGFDPCELFFDPQYRFPRCHAARRLLQKKLGFRTIFDVVPLDARLVRGSHGLPATDPLDAAIVIGRGPKPTEPIPMTAIRDLILQALGLC